MDILKIIIFPIFPFKDLDVRVHSHPPAFATAKVPTRDSQNAFCGPYSCCTTSHHDGTHDGAWAGLSSRMLTNTF
jgi:hypothetical protein